MNTIQHILLAGICAGIAGICTSWLITGVLFHSFQSRTPETWRPNEGPKQYAAASALTMLACLGLCTAFAATNGVHWPVNQPGVVNGLEFGALCWGALALPVIVSSGVFVKLDWGFVFGLLLDWLVVSLLAGGMAGWLIPR